MANVTKWNLSNLRLVALLAAPQISSVGGTVTCRKLDGHAPNKPGIDCSAVFTIAGAAVWQGEESLEGAMDSSIFSAMQEWTHLESACHGARPLGERECRQPCGVALAAKEAEILRMRAQTKPDALIQLRFCATLLERGGGGISTLTAEVIRNAANILGGWAGALQDPGS